MSGAMITALASIFVAAIAAISAIASSRAASKSSTQNNNSTNEAKRLEQAYERARKFDLETIARQDKEIAALRAEVHDLEERVDILRYQLNRSARGLAPDPNAERPKENSDDRPDPPG